MKDLEEFLVSNLFIKYFIGNDFSEFIDYYINNNKPYEIEAVLSNRVSIPTPQNIKYQISNNGNVLFFSQEKNIVALLFGVLSSQFTEKFSVFVSSADTIAHAIKKFRTEEKIFVYGESSTAFVKLRNLGVLKEIMEDTNIAQVEGILTAVNKSIEVNLRTIETLSMVAKDRKNPLFRQILIRKTSDDSQINSVVLEAMTNLELSTTIQKKCLTLLKCEVDKITNPQSKTNHNL